MSAADVAAREREAMLAKCIAETERVIEAAPTFGASAEAVLAALRALTRDARATKARVVVDSLVRDLTGRKGLRQAWDGIDEEIQEEIAQEWAAIVAAAYP